MIYSVIVMLGLLAATDLIRLFGKIKYSSLSVQYFVGQTLIALVLWAIVDYFGKFPSQLIDVILGCIFGSLLYVSMRLIYEALKKDKHASKLE